MEMRDRRCGTDDTTSTPSPPTVASWALALPFGDAFEGLKRSALAFTKISIVVATSINVLGQVRTERGCQLIGDEMPVGCMHHVNTRLNGQPGPKESRF